MTGFVSGLKRLAIDSVDEDDFEEPLVEALLHEVFCRECEVAATFRELKLPGADSVEGAVDDFGAGEALGFSKVKNEIVELPFMRERACECFLEFITRDLGAEDDEGVDGKGFTEAAEFDAIFFCFEDCGEIVALVGDAEVTAFGGATDVKRGMRPEAREEKITEGIVMTSHENVAGFQKLPDFFAHFVGHSFYRTWWFDKGLLHFGDGRATEPEEMKHDLGVTGAGTAVE